MIDYIQYHNEETLGYAVACKQGEPFFIFTNKGTRTSVGKRVWLVSGADTPRTYRLCCTFIVDDAGPDNGGEFKNRAHGRHGIEFPTRPILNDLPWFRDLWLSQARFSIGFQQLKPQFALDLRAFARTFPDGNDHLRDNAID